ncbi:MAG: DUF4363 family protein [Ruminococcus sp.]|nr:DUF4363 family protein [Ruminococcus sp.]
MTRMIMSGCILVTLLVMSIFSCMTVDRNCREIEQSTDKIWELYTSGDVQGAKDEAAELEARWEKVRSTYAVLVNNGRLNEMDRVTSRIYYLVENDSRELHSELTELEHISKGLRAGETPKLTSIF